MPTTSYGAFALTNVFGVDVEPEEPFTPDVAARPDGGFVVVFGSINHIPPPNAIVDGPIRLRAFDANGQPITAGEIIVNTTQDGFQRDAQVAVASNGVIAV